MPATAHPAPVSRDALIGVIRDVFDHVVDAHARGAPPPALQPAIDEARALQQHDNTGGLDEPAFDVALQKVAHGAIATIARLRAAGSVGGQTPEEGRA